MANEAANLKRANKAKSALKKAGYLEGEPDVATAIQDLVSDLMHLYDRCPIELFHPPWSKLHSMAAANYQAEITGDGFDDAEESAVAP